MSDPLARTDNSIERQSVGFAVYGQTKRSTAYGVDAGGDKTLITKACARRYPSVPTDDSYFPNTKTENVTGIIGGRGWGLRQAKAPTRLASHTRS
jgi:hypothetical protein